MSDIFSSPSENTGPTSSQSTSETRATPTPTQSSQSPSPSQSHAQPPSHTQSPTQPSQAQPSQAQPSQAQPSTPATDAPSSAPAPASVARRRPLFSTMFWGVVLLAFAVFMIATTLLPIPLDPSLWLLGSVLAAGLVLVVAGIAAASRRAG